MDAPVPTAAATESRAGDIFVGGAMRSGTTLVQRILCTDPSANEALPEVHVIREFVSLIDQCQQNVGNLAPVFEGKEDLLGFGSELVDVLLQRIRSRYGSDDSPLILKNPELTRRFAFLSELRPSARFVIVLRDPRDGVVSMRRVIQRAANLGVADAADGDSASIGKLAHVFLSYYAPLADLEFLKHHDRYCVVRFEDLVQHPVEIIQRLSFWTGLSLDTALEEVTSGGDDGSIFGAEFYGKPITAAAVGRYKTDLSAAEIEQVEKISGFFLERYGYV
ncbi:MAG: sulfotransferase [Alphaproteobacteria bacterium]|jgi:hypothetical protein|nr:sulfotransferase [Alphaproteobacteria bacterium]